MLIMVYQSVNDVDDNGVDYTFVWENGIQGK
jgi:hypothetical protein